MSTLNSFLDDGLPAAEQSAADPAAAVVAPAEVDGAAVSPAAAPVDPKVEAKPEVKADPPDEDVPEDQRGLLAALHATRKLRNDHKGRADKLEGEAAELRAQLAEARKAPPASPPAPVVAPEPVAVPSPLEDPQGYQAHQQRLLFNERLNMSEMLLRQKHGDAEVDAKLAVFKKAATDNPALRAGLTQQVHPYQWAYDQAQRISAMEEIGSDPAAYRAKVEAELRAKIEAEVAGGDPGDQGRPAVVLPTSLGTARSAAPRLPAVVEAPEFEDIFKRPKRA